jgi:hypothetical protein
MRLDLAFASKTYRDTRLQTDFGRVMMQNRDTCASMALSSASCRENYKTKSDIANRLRLWFLTFFFFSATSRSLSAW